jgi:hypothetical protein
VKALLLLLLVGGLGGYVFYQRHHNYPFDSVTSGSAKYEVYRMPAECRAVVICVERVAYLAVEADSATVKEEARGLLPWVDATVKPGSGAAAIMLVALEPGFLRMKPPRRMIGVTFGRLPGDQWRYLGQEDVTAKLAPMFR